jgi:MFS family permease
MCERKGDVTRYPLKQTIHWLGFLANQMRQRNQTVFAIEEFQPDWLPKRLRIYYGCSVGLSVGLLCGLLSGLAFGSVFGQVAGLIAGLLGGGEVGLVIGIQSKITFAESFSWSWKGSFNWIRFGTIIALVSIPILALFFSSVFGPVLGSGFGAVGGLSIGLCIGPILGLQAKQSIERSSFRPGEGFRRSAKNGLSVGLIVGFITALIAGLLSEGVVMLASAHTITAGNELFFNLLAAGPASGLFVGILAGLLAGLLSGLFAVFRYLLLCLLLAYGDNFPWQPIAFLDNACERALLKRVGGTYRFIHRLVCDYFADLEQHSAHLPIDPTTVQKMGLPVQHQDSGEIR